MSYYDIYNLRLNHYGTDYQSRIQAKREKEFQLYLNKSVYRIEFIFGEETVVGSFEKYKQDETETLHYLLTPINVFIPNGTVLFMTGRPRANENFSSIPMNLYENQNLPLNDSNKEGLQITNINTSLKDKDPWMVYYLENIKASGYNRYIMLRMTHYIEWLSRDGSIKNSWAYLYGQENNMLKDELKSRSRMDTLYTENLKSSFLIMPKNEYIQKDDYLLIGVDPFKESYRVTGYDRQSSDGVEYVTIDPIYEYDLSASPAQGPTDPNEDFFWINGGISNA